MRTIYKISEFAAMCGISRDTLLYYDKIGILKPSFVAENGYRYYTSGQFCIADIISILKGSGSSLKEIEQYLTNPKPSSSLSILKQRLNALKEQERHLQEMQRSLSLTIDSLKEGIHCVCGVVNICDLPKQYMIATQTHYRDFPTEQQFTDVLRDHFSYCDRRGFCARFQTGEIILKKDALAKKFVESYYFNPIDEPVSDERLIVKPAGRYAVYYHQGSYAQLPHIYSGFIEAIQKEGYLLDGDIYEDDVIDYFSASDPNNYIFKISAKVCPMPAQP